MTILRAWKLQNPCDDIISSRVDGEQWKELAVAMVESAVSEHRDDYPEVAAAPVGPVVGGHRRWRGVGGLAHAGVLLDEWHEAERLGLCTTLNR